MALSNAEQKCQRRSIYFIHASFDILELYVESILYQINNTDLYLNVVLDHSCCYLNGFPACGEHAAKAWLFAAQFSTRKANLDKLIGAMQRSHSNVSVRTNAQQRSCEWQKKPTTERIDFCAIFFIFTTQQQRSFVFFSIAMQMIILTMHASIIASWAGFRKHDCHGFIVSRKVNFLAGESTYGKIVLMRMNGPHSVEGIYWSLTFRNLVSFFWVIHVNNSNAWIAKLFAIRCLQPWARRFSGRMKPTMLWPKI